MTSEGCAKIENTRKEGRNARQRRGGNRRVRTDESCLNIREGDARGVCDRDANLRPTGPALSPSSDPVGLLVGLELTEAAELGGIRHIGISLGCWISCVLNPEPTRFCAKKVSILCRVGPDLELFFCISSVQLQKTERMTDNVVFLQRGPAVVQLLNIHPALSKTQR